MNKQYNNTKEIMTEHVFDDWIKTHKEEIMINVMTTKGIVNQIQPNVSDKA